jgi:hypothetical protein
MNDNRQENIRKNQMPEEIPPWMQTADLVGDQRKFQEFITYLRDDAADQLPDICSNDLTATENKRISIPAPRGAVVKTDCGYSYYQAEDQLKELFDCVKEAQKPPTLFETIMRYFKLAIKT